MHGSTRTEFPGSLVAAVPSEQVEGIVLFSGAEIKGSKITSELMVWEEACRIRRRNTLGGIRSPHMPPLKPVGDATM